MMQRVTAMILALMVSTALIGIDQVQARPAKCLDTRYLVSSGPLVPGEPGSDAIIVGADGKVSLAPCGLGKGKAKSFGPKKSPKGDKLVITWPKCSGASDPKKFKNIKLTATIAADCSAITSATIKGKNVPKTSFGAGQSTGCGDGLVDGGRGETCDGGGCPSGQVCTSACACVTTTTSTTSTSSTTQSTSSTTPTTTTTTTSTTSTTAPPSGCANGAPNGVVEPGLGEECDDSDPAAPLGCAQCILCGNGVITTPQEECDDGNLINGDSCPSDCRIQVCGDNRTSGDESCDDGNLLNTDTCPSDCKIDQCAPNTGSSQFVTVSFATSASVAGISVLLDYPEGRVSIPGSGGAALVQGRISGTPGGTSAVANDLDHALREAVQNSTPFTSITPGQLFRVNFENCQGAPAPQASDFTCTVLGANEPFNGNDVTAATSCSVAVP